jgi:putative transposase
MARISCIVVPGYPHHVTQRGVRSMQVFHRDEERRAYLRYTRLKNFAEGVRG